MRLSCPRIEVLPFLVSSNSRLLEVVQLIEQQKLSALTVIRDNGVWSELNQADSRMIYEGTIAFDGELNKPALGIFERLCKLNNVSAYRFLNGQRIGSTKAIKTTQTHRSRKKNRIG